MQLANGLVDAQGWCRGMGIVEKVEEVKGEGLGGGIAFVRTPVNEDILKGCIVRLVFGWQAGIIYRGKD